MKVLLHVDDSSHWHAAARLARALVTRDGDRLVAFSTQWSRVKRERAFEDARRVLDLPAERFTTRARPGLAEYVIPEEAREGDYDLVVVGRLGALDRVTNGLVALLLARFTPTNVLIVRGRPKGVARVLASAAGGPETTTLARAGAVLARAHHAPLTLLHVVSQFGLTDASAAAVDRLAKEFLRSDTPEAQAILSARETVSRAGVPVVIRVRAGLVVDEIMDEVRERAHDVLVVGVHGMGVREKLLTEDLSAHVLRVAPVSVLVVKHLGPAWSLEHG